MIDIILKEDLFKLLGNKRWIQKRSFSNELHILFSFK